MSYSYSQLQILQQCERRWALRYKEGLRPTLQKPWALMRGQVWHAVMAAEAAWWGVETGSLLSRPSEIRVLDELPLILLGNGGNSWDAVRAEDVVNVVAEWETKQESDFLDQMREEFGGLLSERIWNLWLRFSQGKTCDELFGRPMLVEYSWARDLPNGLELAGVTDLVYHDQNTDQIVVRDWKLHQYWPSTPPAIEDLVNSQLHLNAWGIAPALRRLSGSEALAPDCVEYARARFKKPAMPTLTKGTAKSAPRLAKTTTDYDAYTYAEFCASTEAVAVGYQMDEEYYYELLAQRDKWFRLQRKPLLYNVYSQHVLSAASQALRSESLTTENSVAVYGSHCGTCEFNQLCRADLMGGRQPYDEVDVRDYGLTRKVVH